MSDHDHGATFAIVCTHVADGERPATEVFHMPGAEFQLLCGADDHDMDELTTMCGGCAFELHVQGMRPSDLPGGYVLERRNMGEVWNRRPMREDELDEDEDISKL